jgi:chitinase
VVDRSIENKMFSTHWTTRIWFATVAIGCGLGIGTAQTVPTFRYRANGNEYTLAARDPALGGTTKIPVTIVPVNLRFASAKQEMNARSDVDALVRSPVFTPFFFPGEGKVQYGDGLLRATFPKHENWHTTFTPHLSQDAVEIDVPAADGYVLRSAATEQRVAIADIEYVQRELFKRVPKQGGLVLAITHNTAYYAEGDATICCLWGTHGLDEGTGNSFVLASYLSDAPAVVQDKDVQPATEQLAEFINDPMHDPLVRQQPSGVPGNRFPRWLRPAAMRPGDEGPCGGSGVASPYFLLEPTDTNGKNDFPFSPPFSTSKGGTTYHVQNAALLRWYVGASPDLGKSFSFPDPKLLPTAGKPCPASPQAAMQTQAKPAPTEGAANGHALIGYWTGSDRNGTTFHLRDVAPQWDVIIVAFAIPDRNAPEGTLRFEPPQGISSSQLKREISDLQSERKKVLISLGGGGQYFTLDDPHAVPNFVNTVTSIVKQYGFDGIDLDFETPSLTLAPGDMDFKHPTTPSIVNLIDGLRQLRTSFGPNFVISLVPEGPQIPAGHVTYGGQFGSYLPLAYGIRDILSFMDVQDYNTPPLEGLDGEIYQSGSVDYHAAMTELVLHGFSVARQTTNMFPASPQNQVATGFLIGYTTPQIVAAAMRYIITGERPPGTRYALRNPGGYPAMIGAMFWTIDADRDESYQFSNAIGPELHRFVRPKF